MITIRYADLPEGLHARAEARGKRTVIYLRPGLTAEQRRLSLRRARQSARMGYGPRLPGPGVALAVARHVSAGTLRNLGAAVRRHPIVFMLLFAGFAGLMLSYTLFVTVSVRLMLNPAQATAVTQGPPPARVQPPTPAPGQGGAIAPGPALPASRQQRAHLGTPLATAEHDRRAPAPGPTAMTPSPSPSPTASPCRRLHLHRRPPPCRSPHFHPHRPRPPSPSLSACIAVSPGRVCR